jgi:hypothetical protein
MGEKKWIDMRDDPDPLHHLMYLCETGRMIDQHCAPYLQEIEDQRTWIPVGNRLPEHSDHVLVLHQRIEDGEVYENVRVGYYLTAWIVYGGYDDFEVTHWMPIPPTPEPTP